METDKVKIPIDEYRQLCFARQQLTTVWDYLERMAKDGNEYVHINIIAIMAGCDDDVSELLREYKEADKDDG